MKKIILWLAVLCVTYGLFCASLSVSAASADEAIQLTYSNLNSDTARAEVRAVLTSAGIKPEHLDHLTRWIVDYNDAMRTCPAFSLVGDFITVDTVAVDYGSYADMSTAWFKRNHRNYHDLLCRIVAFELTRDMISVGNTLDKETYRCWDVQTDWLFTDGQILFGGEDVMVNKTYDPYPLLTWNDETIAAYFTLFDPIFITDGSGESAMLSAIREKWQQQQVVFQDCGYSLITFWRLSGNVLFVSHAAVLVETGDGCLLVEKTNPEAPYAATKHDSADRVHQYLYQSMVLEFAKDDLVVGPYLILKNDAPL